MSEEVEAIRAVEDGAEAAPCIPSEEWWFYDLVTGVPAMGSMLLPHEAAAVANTPPGFGATRKPIDPRTQRFDPLTMDVLPYPRPGPDDDLLAEMAREKRDALMRSTSWVRERATDFGQPVPQAWRDYWQALRDVPAQAGFPREIQWPVRPEV
jgi:hypothetical protein